MADIKYDVDESVDHVFDEKGNVFLAMRKVAWGNGDHKLELRKWHTQKDGSERPNKGFSFLTEDGPDTLTSILVQEGHGDTREVLSHLSKRDNFNSSLNSIVGKDSEFYDESAGEEYDPKDILAL